MRLKQDSAEQRECHETLLRMVRSQGTAMAEGDDRLGAEIQRGDEHHRQLEEIQ